MPSLVVGAPGDAVEVSERVELNPDGSDTRTWTPVEVDDGIVITSVDPLDTLLRQIVEGYFVLTDGQGSVSKWSEPAELLFGRPAQEILGQSFFGTLVDQPLPAAAESWRAFLEQGTAPTAPGRVAVQGRHAEGFNFPVDAMYSGLLERRSDVISRSRRRGGVRGNGE